MSKKKEPTCDLCQKNEGSAYWSIHSGLGRIIATFMLYNRDIGKAGHAVNICRDCLKKSLKD